MRTAGAAVYVRALGETQFRAFVTWACDAEVPQSPYYTPKVFDWVLETGEALVLPALDEEQLPMVASTAEGFGARAGGGSDHQPP